MKTIYDLSAKACGSDRCPKFVLDERTGAMSFVDKQGKKANLTVAEFNRFVRAVKEGKIKELK
jgi:hypothetical protein